jgi:hypothetical protein
MANPSVTVNVSRTKKRLTEDFEALVACIGDLKNAFTNGGTLMIV